MVEIKVLKKVTEHLHWKKIDHELYRVYVFPDGKEVRIEKPALINISKSGGARILDSNNVSHYIPFKWIHLYWETDDNNAFWW